MGKERQTTSTNTQSAQTQVSTPTAEETEMNKLALERERAAQSGMMQTQRFGLDLISQLLAGKPLPGYLSSLPQGISEPVISDMIGQSLRDVNVQLAKSGAGTFMESGASQAIGARTAGDIRNSVQEYNLGNLFNLLNLAVGGQAQIQQPILAQSSLLSQRLAGLRSTTSMGNTSGMSTTLGMNPFMKSFQTSSGSALGKAAVGGGTGFLGGLF